MIAWFFSRLVAFLRDPVGGPAALGVLVVAGTAWSMGWVVATGAAGLVLFALVLLTPGGPQHPVPA